MKGVEKVPMEKGEEKKNSVRLTFISYEDVNDGNGDFRSLIPFMQQENHTDGWCHCWSVRLADG